MPLAQIRANYVLKKTNADFSYKFNFLALDGSAHCLKYGVDDLKKFIAFLDHKGRNGNGLTFTQTLAWIKNTNGQTLPNSESLKTDLFK